MPPKLGLLAGGGTLPRRIVDACSAQGREVFVIAFEGATDAGTVAGTSHCWVKLEAMGRIVSALKAKGVEELVLAGPLPRPSWSTLRPDLRGLRLLPKILAAGQGDDAILTLAVAELEAEGFIVVGAHEILPELLAPPGALGSVAPDRTALADIARGVEVARAVGAVDVGQAVVVQQGIVLGVEADEGTDALIERTATLSRKGPGGVLVKCRKPQQDSRVDLPSIGPGTVARARDAGLRGIAVEAGATLVIERAAVTREADAAGVFVFGFDGRSRGTPAPESTG
jgi:hypothetical protein